MNDLLQENGIKLYRYCKRNGLEMKWVNKKTGKFIITSEYLEAYVWPKSMTLEIKMRNEVRLNWKPFKLKSREFDEKEFIDRLYSNVRTPKDSDYNRPRILKGHGKVVHMSIRPSSTPDEKREALAYLSRYSQKIKAQNIYY